MTIIKLEGIDTISITDELEKITLAEIMRIPMIINGDIEDAYAHGGFFIRYLIDNTPLKNTKRYTSIFSSVQVMKPPAIMVPSLNWHVDGTGVPHISEDIFHIMMCDNSKLATQFFNKGVDWEVDDSVNRMNHKELREVLDLEVEGFGIEPVDIEANRIYTWGCRHPHRAIPPTETSIRFFWKVHESDNHQPTRREESFKKHSTVILGHEGESVLSVEQGDRGIILRDNTY
jgi:hypothetical protein